MRINPVTFEPLVGTHEEAECAGQPCVLHNPTEGWPLAGHPLDWDMSERRMNRVCGHGVHHPDIDDLYYRLDRGAMYDGKLEIFNAHACDGCCEDFDYVLHPRAYKAIGHAPTMERARTLAEQFDWPVGWWVWHRPTKVLYLRIRDKQFIPEKWS